MEQPGGDVHSGRGPGLARTGTGKPGPGLTRGSTSAVLARGYKPRASGEPKARPLTVWTGSCA
jgi:hypothetical protein